MKSTFLKVVDLTSDDIDSRSGVRLH